MEAELQDIQLQPTTTLATTNWDALIIILGDHRVGKSHSTNWDALIIILVDHEVGKSHSINWDALIIILGDH